LYASLECIYQSLLFYMPMRRNMNAKSRPFRFIAIEMNKESDDNLRAGGAQVIFNTQFYLQSRQGLQPLFSAGVFL